METKAVVFTHLSVQKKDVPKFQNIITVGWIDTNNPEFLPDSNR